MVIDCSFRQFFGIDFIYGMAIQCYDNEFSGEHEERLTTTSFGMMEGRVHGGKST